MLVSGRVSLQDWKNLNLEVRVPNNREVLIRPVFGGHLGHDPTWEKKNKKISRFTRIKPPGSKRKRHGDCNLTYSKHLNKQL